MPSAARVSESSYTAREFAQLANLAEVTVRRRIALGDIPSFKIGAARRIPADYVEKLLAVDGVSS